MHHCDVRLPSFLTTVCTADMNTMPVINLVGLENSFGCGRGLLVGRMGSEASLTATQRARTMCVHVS